MKKFCLIILIIAVLFSCKKNEEITIPIPEISYVSISSTEVVEFNNELQITFSYIDRDGDLGYQDPDVYALRIKDARLNDFDWYHIPPLTPNEMELEIEGEFTVYLAPLFLLGNGSQEATNFTLQIQDRAGNWSNQIATPQVLINDSL